MLLDRDGVINHDSPDYVKNAAGLLLAAMQRLEIDAADTSVTRVFADLGAVGQVLGGDP